MIQAVIFDLDGVIVTTDEQHYRAWKAVADQEEIYFDRKINDRLRGVSRMASLEIILERSAKTYTQTQKEEMAARKNAIYVEQLDALTPADILPGVLQTLKDLKDAGLQTAIGSSSKNTKTILGKLGLLQAFDAIADGTDITRSKPDPEVFLCAAGKLHLKPEECAVVEDASAGIAAAKAGGMYAIAFGGDAASNPNADAVIASPLEILHVVHAFGKA